ncbi:MAG: prepilin-type N-terminal cleavage/methylation domain-containing protein [Proteobacteria bacterium]|nr:prepilin-type N-terminal cleavage/methylation domain-containing protein [Pseudomonadota bacterium]HQR03747.1 prepilin-type N-terminal cleavage/methylation domain-containing protein [Rhodocyclaceae bacterium]
MRKYQSGFTLVEIAIVLVIIGLLLGGVLKGQELINSAKIKNVINDFTSTSAAIYGYQDRYKTLPGDDTGTARWPASTGFPAGLVGNGNSIIDNAGAACAFTSNSGNTNECYSIWVDLRQAGFITGALTSGPPQNAYGGILGVQNGNDALQTGGVAGTGFKGPIICETNIPDKAAIAIDNQLDDGNPQTGSVRSLLQADAVTPAAVSGVAASANYLETSTNYYTVCKAQ